MHEYSIRSACSIAQQQVTRFHHPDQVIVTGRLVVVQLYLFGESCWLFAQHLIMWWLQTLQSIPNHSGRIIDILMTILKTCAGTLLSLWFFSQYSSGNPESPHTALNGRKYNYKSYVVLKDALLPSILNSEKSTP